MEYIPVQVSSIDMAFGGKAMELLPPYKEIPEEFKRGSHPASKFASDWFFKGLSAKPKAKPGIDLDLALCNIQACLTDFAPKHEHKIAGAAYLSNLWFDLS